MDDIDQEDINLFWKCVDDYKLPDHLIDTTEYSNESEGSYESSDIKTTNLFLQDQNQLVILNSIHKQLIIKAYHAIVEYFKHDSPRNHRFYKDPTDPYDGICLGSDYIIDFVDGIIMCGKQQYDDFCSNPFKGDIMKYLSRGVSCGNSCCL